MEKALRLPTNHPRHLAATETTKQRLVRNSWRKRSNQLAAEHKSLFVEDRKPITFFDVRPWERDIGNARIFPSLPGISGRDDVPEKKLEAALKRIREFNSTFDIYTDGSASAGTFNGGSGVVITTGDPAEPHVVKTLEKKGAKYTCSYNEEFQALEVALDWAERVCTSNDAIAFMTDSKSLCDALIGYGTDVDILRRRIRNATFKLTIQWIPGHSNIPGNDLADEAAKRAAEAPGPFNPTSYGSICSQIRAATKDPPIEHQRTREVYRCLSWEKEKEIRSRDDQSLLAKLRAGHHPALKAYKARIDRVTDPTCPLCEEEDQDMEHWFTRCPGTELKRWLLFGDDSGKLECLTKHPIKAVTLARQTLGVQCKSTTR